ncbi:MAG: hypothetical protein ACXADY_07980 [Candidatus Hodarchaeales archaeon]
MINTIVPSYKDFYIIKDFHEFLNQNNKQERLLFAFSVGFDKRSIESVKIISNYSKDLLIDFLKIELEEESVSQDENTIDYFLENLKIVNSLIKDNHNYNTKINISNDSNEFLSHIQGYIKAVIDENPPSWLLIDIGALPRDYYFILINFCVKQYGSDLKIAVVNTEYEKIGYEPIRSEYSNPITLSSFHISDFSDPLEVLKELQVWIPILGKETSPINRILTEYPDFPLIFPLIPFPSVYPPDSDLILLENKYFFKAGYFQFENIMRTPYTNPFEVAKEIGKLYTKLNEVFQPQKTKLTFYISPYGSKMQNLGACLAAIKYEMCVLYSKPGTYEIDESIQEPDFSGTKVYFLNP